MNKGSSLVSSKWWSDRTAKVLQATKQVTATGCEHHGVLGCDTVSVCAET